jgi:transcriptional regulator with PAS, ATPase and Fis domain
MASARPNEFLSFKDVYAANDSADNMDLSPSAIIDTTAEEFDPANLSEREQIRMALERNFGRRKAAAMELNISERTLYRKIKEYGLE